MRAHYLIPVLTLALLGADGAAPSGGSITGSVVAVKDGKQVNRTYVFVYLQPIGRSTGDNPGAGVTRKIVQKQRAFVPRAIVVPVGAEVSFPNADAEIHNVFSSTDPPFNLGRYKTDNKGKAHKFEDEDEFDIYCDMHREMWAKVKVVDTPYIAQVVGGKFTFSKIPAGKYKVVAWAPNSPEVRSGEITVIDGKTTPLDRELHLQIKSRSGCHDRWDKTKYPSQNYSQCPPDFP